MKCPNFYDENNSFCRNKCEHSEECKIDCETYAAKHQEDYPQIMLDV